MPQQTRFFIPRHSLTMAVIWGALLSVLLMACGQDKKDETAQRSTPTSTTQAGLQVGDPAPSFSLSASDGSTVTLDDYKGKQPVLLFFHMADG